jgi:hypothetical protein
VEILAKPARPLAERVDGCPQLVGANADPLLQLRNSKQSLS